MGKAQVLGDFVDWALTGAEIQSELGYILCPKSWMQSAAEKDYKVKPS